MKDLPLDGIRISITLEYPEGFGTIATTPVPDDKHTFETTLKVIAEQAWRHKEHEQKITTPQG